MALDSPPSTSQCSCGFSVVRITHFLAYMHQALAFTTFIIGVLLADHTVILGLCITMATLIGMCSSLAIIFGLRVKNRHFLKPLLLLLIFEALLCLAAAIWICLGLSKSIESQNRALQNEYAIGEDASMLVVMIVLMLFFCWCSFTVNKCIKFWLRISELQSDPANVISDEVALEMNWDILQRQAGCALPPPPPAYQENLPVILRVDQLPQVQIHTRGSFSFENPPPDYDVKQDVMPPAYDQISVHIDISTSDHLVKDGDN